jgi:hypothetical protein
MAWIKEREEHRHDWTDTLKSAPSSRTLTGMETNQLFIQPSSISKELMSALTALELLVTRQTTRRTSSGSSAGTAYDGMYWNANRYDG